MASGYALPAPNGHHAPSHSRSHSALHLAPAPPAAPATSNGLAVKKAASLYTLRETSPLASPLYEPQAFYTPVEQNRYAFQENHSRDNAAAGGGSGHSHAKSWSPMKSTRARGESDLGRPADPRAQSYRPTLDRLDSVPHNHTHSHNHDPRTPPLLSLPEALTALLLPLPYLLASAAYSLLSGEDLSGGTHPLPTHAIMQHGASGQGRILPRRRYAGELGGVIEALTLTSGALLVVGILGVVLGGKSSSSGGGRALDRRKGSGGGGLAGGGSGLLSLASARAMLLRALSVGLPFYATMQIGGLRTGLALLATTAAALPAITSLADVKTALTTRKATSAVILLSIVLDFLGCTFHAPVADMALGYLALLISAFVLPVPLPSTTNSNNPNNTTTPPLTLLTGALLTLSTLVLSTHYATSPSLDPHALAFSTLSVAATAACTLFSSPQLLQRNAMKSGLGVGCLAIASCAFLFSPTLWPGTVANGGLAALGFLGVVFDASGESEGEEGHAHMHHEHGHGHGHDHHQHDAAGKTASSNSSGGAAVEASSWLTRTLLTYCDPTSLAHGILSEKDSRRIAYFTLLNFAFMLLQAAYASLSGSLGLLSDTVHMFFDCLGLVVGLAAAVYSKRAPTPSNPYGWSKLNTLAGFGNGVFLMLVSVEFVWEAMEGIRGGRELRHVGELMVVSCAGLAVNLVGLMVFGHAHAHGGEGCGHGHGHAGHDEHAHEHSHAQHAGHDEHEAHSHTHGNSTPSHAHSHAQNENMRGIYLHIAADAGGSLAVITSTALTLYSPWYLWDPLATIFIAVLIFAAAVPLVASSGQKLLLVVPEALEYGIKQTLLEVGELRGVAGVRGPRFWVDERGGGGGGGHGHEGHGHDEHGGGGGAGGSAVMGVMHVIASPAADVEDVRRRVAGFVGARGMDVVVCVEREAVWGVGGGSVEVGASKGGVRFE
ncbi:hypothetical protein LTR08_003785 [Meristemomyces frigidus]|nr:hypothetical protein LTR08_003785 [Meristemomyces frigidus]